MAKTSKKQTAPREELPEETRLRRAVAKMRLAQIKNARAMLATYAAADRGRRNKDWRASPASADAAIIPDASTLNARARQFVRDSGVGESIVQAFERNVVRCGITPIPTAKDKTGKLLGKFNKKMLRDFWEWANDHLHCDVQKQQSFWQKQSLAVREDVTVGEAFVIWSYKPNPDSVGLRLQSVEPEQLDTTILSWVDPDTGRTNEVRGGKEVDEDGAAVAYHFFTRNPADYLTRVTYKSVRVPASRVFHYFKQTRVMQSRGVTRLAPVMQDGRDLNRYRDSTLWRAIMEACIGMIVKKELPTGIGQRLGVPAAAGDPGQTPSGMRTMDFFPGMVPELLPGESIEPYIPSSPGNNYDPYVSSTLRGIAAGVGLSNGQVTRQCESNYSAARQDMLEDRGTFEPEQERMAHGLVLPIFRLFVRFAYLEGKLDEFITPEEFATEFRRFTEADYIAPAQPWIDPEKEANAYEKLLELKVLTREEIAHLRQMRLSDIWEKLEAEQNEAKARNITLPENKDDPTVAFKRETIKSFIADGTVADVIANKTDLGALVRDAGLTENKEYEEPYLPVVSPPGDMVSGDVIKKDGAIVGGDVVKEPEPTPPAQPAVPGKTPPAATLPAADPAKAALATLPVLPATPKKPPHYREAIGDLVACQTCSFYVEGRCVKFDYDAAADHLCDAWEAKPLNADSLQPGRGKAFPNVQTQGRSIDDPNGLFLSRSERGVE